LTIILIIILNVSNQKTNTKIRILIWNTPTLSLGNYLAISSGAGFIFSFILTTNLASLIKFKSVNSLKYKTETTNEKSNEYNFSKIKNNVEKTLIERNINDPSPTINAQFRVIGKTERYNSYLDENNLKYENTYEYNDPYVEQNEDNETISKGNDVSSDWNDDSFTSW
tara:strand:- start:3306 stop:3809 length:504 start_codon:yes stop_codon:yes gene_type:complete